METADRLSLSLSLSLSLTHTHTHTYPPLLARKDLLVGRRSHITFVSCQSHEGKIILKMIGPHKFFIDVFRSFFCGPAGQTARGGVFSQWLLRDRLVFLDIEQKMTSFRGGARWAKRYHLEASKQRCHAT